MVIVSELVPHPRVSITSMVVILSVSARVIVGATGRPANGIIRAVQCKVHGGYTFLFDTLSMVTSTMVLTC